MMKKRHSRRPIEQTPSPHRKLYVGTKPGETPPSMQALVIVSKLDPAPSTNGTIDCPGCGGVFRYARLANGKLMGTCDTCITTIPRA